jgi:cytochrome c2
LVGVGQKYDTGTLRSILSQPTDAMSDGGMQPVDIKEGDLTALIAFLESVK